MGKLKKKQAKSNSSSIAVNRKAHHDYNLGERFEAGLVLQGWEVKSLRAGKGQIVDSYVLVKHGIPTLLGAQIQPLLSASTHIRAEPERSRKLLLHKEEIKKLIGLTEIRGNTLIPTKLYWKKNRVKVEIALAKGKKSFDKRETDKQRSWQREKQRLFKKSQ